MAIVVGNTSSGTASATTVTVSHTVASGSNRLLVVATCVLQASVPNYTGVTFNGIAMTKIDDALTGGGLRRTALWYLLAPDVGTFNIVVTVDALPVWLRCANADYTGVAQQAYESTAKIDQNVTSPTDVPVTLSPSTANSWFMGAADARSAIITSGTNSFYRVGSTNDEPVLIDTNGAIAGTGNTTFSYSAGVGTDWEQFITASFAPAGGGGTAPVSLLSLMGVG